MMNSSRLAVALAVLMPACAAFAGSSVASTVPADWTSLVTRSAAPLDANTAVSRDAMGRGRSAGIAPTLPEQLDATIPGTQMPFYLINVGLLDLQHSPDTGCASVDDPACDAPR